MQTQQFQKISEQQIAKQGAVSAMEIRNGSQLSVNSSIGDTTQRLSELGKALKKLLNPCGDSLLPGYAELIQLVKTTTVSAEEERKEEGRKHYEAQISRFNKDRRQLVREDKIVRNFLHNKREQLYQIIEDNLKKLKEWPEDHTFLSPLTAEQKVARAEESLRNPQFLVLSNIIKRSRLQTLLPSMRSPLSRKKQMASRLDASPHDRGAKNRSVSVNEVRSDYNFSALLEHTREIKLSDLGMLLEDLEIVELENEIARQELAVRGYERGDDTAIAQNKLILGHIQTRPTLSELLQRSIDKRDKAAAEQAVIKLEQMQRFRLKNLAGRVNSMLGLPEVGAIGEPGPSIDGHTTWLAKDSNGDRRESLMTDPSYNASPSRRALHAFNAVVSNQLQSSKYLAAAASQLQSAQAANLAEGGQDTYTYEKINALLQAADRLYKFTNDLDDSEEEELSDEELKQRIKLRKARDRAKRDHLTMVKTAAIEAATTIESVRNQISVGSILSKGLNLEELKRRQAMLRDKIDMADDTQAFAARDQQTEGMGHSYSFTQLDREAVEAGEVCSASSSSQDDFGVKLHRLESMPDTVRALEREMRKYQGADAKRVDSLDMERLAKYEFKASFISHLCPVKGKQAEYKSRLRTFDHHKSTKTNLINQAFLEKKIYEKMHKKSSQKSSALSMYEGFSICEFSAQQPMSSLHFQSIEKNFEESVGSLMLSTAKQMGTQEMHDCRLLNKDLDSVPMDDVLRSTELVTQPTPVDHSESPRSHSNGKLFKPLPVKKARGLEEERFSVPRESEDLDRVDSGGVQLQKPNARALAGPKDRQKGAKQLQQEAQFDSEVPANTHFSTLSLQIVLSPRQGSESSRSDQGLYKSLSLPQKIFKRSLKQQNESTVTVLDPSRELQTSALLIEATDCHVPESSEAVRLIRDESQEGRFTETLKLVEGEPNEILKLIQQSIAASNATPPLVTQSSSTTVGRLEMLQKLEKMADSNALRQPNELDDQQTRNFFNQVSPNTQNGRKQAKDFGDENQTKAREDGLGHPRVSPQSLICSEPDIDPLHEMLLRTSSQPKKTNVQRNDMPKLPVEAEITQTLNTDTLKSASGGTTPQFIVSPKLEKAAASQNVDTELDSQQTRTVAQQKEPLRSTQFDFNFPRQDSDFHANPAINNSSVSQHVRNKVIKRLGGTQSTSFGSKDSKQTSPHAQTRPNRADLSKTTYVQTGNEVQPKETSLQCGPKRLNAIMAHEFSIGSISNLREMVAQKMHLLGPTEFLALSSGFATPQEEKAHAAGDQKQVPRKVESKVAHNMAKNVIKLELQERRSNHSSHYESSSIKKQRGAAEGKPKQVMLKEQSTLADLALGEEVGNNTASNEMSEGLTSSRGGVFVKSNVNFGKRLSDDSQVQVQTQGMASHLNLADAATSPLLVLSKPISPMDPSQGGPSTSNTQQARNHVKRSTAANKRAAAKLEPQSTVSFSQLPSQAIATEIRKLSISILTTNGKSGRDTSTKDHEDDVNRLRVTPNTLKQNIEESQSGTLTRNMLTPYLQSTNVKIALQKERTKRFIHHSTNPPGLVDQLRIQSRPFDLNLNLSGEAVKENRASGGASEMKMLPSPEANADADTDERRDQLVIRRKASQIENPLIQCSEEDEGERSVKRPIDLTKTIDPSAFESVPMSSDGFGKAEYEALDNLQVQAWSSQYSMAQKKASEGLARASKLALAERESMVCAGSPSQVQIENDIKEMQRLLPSSYEGQNGEQISRNDDLQSFDLQLAKPRESSVPLVYIRDRSRVKHENKNGQGKNLGECQLQSYQEASKQKDVMRFQSYAPTPLSILVEKNLGADREVTLHSARGSAVTLRASQQTSLVKGSNPETQKNISHRTRLPALNRSQNTTLDASAAPRQSMGSQSSIGKPNETKVVEKRIANNFAIKMKRQLNQSVVVDSRIKTQVLDGDTVSQWQTAERPGAEKQRNRVDRARLQSQILVYGGKDVTSFRETRQGSDSKHPFHKTISQSLMNPTDLVPLNHPKFAPKSLFSKQQKVGDRTRGISPKLKNQNQHTESPPRQHGTNSKDFRFHDIESGSVELSLANKVRLASQINKQLAPFSLPSVEKRRDRFEDLMEPKQHSRLKNVTTRVIMGSVDADQVHHELGDTLHSQGSLIAKGPPSHSSTDAMAEARHQSAVVLGQHRRTKDGSQKSPLRIQVPERVSVNIQEQQAERLSVQNNDVSNSGGISPLLTDIEWHIRNPKLLFREEDGILDRMLGGLIEPRFSQTFVGRDAEANQRKNVMTETSQLDNPGQAGVQMPWKAELLFREHQESMARLRQREEELSYHESLHSKQPISFSGQNDIQNSVWFDDVDYKRKQRPELLLRDLQEKTRNGRVEPGKSPFYTQDFIRMDGKHVKLSHTQERKAQRGKF